jgi:hypothetical protein
MQPSSRFSENHVLEQEFGVFYSFSLYSMIYRIQTFFISTSIILGCVFFYFLKMLFLRNLAGDIKLAPLKKNTFFDSVSSILVLPDLRNNIFQRKNNTHFALFLIITKNVSTKKCSMGFLGSEEG